MNPRYSYFEKGNAFNEWHRTIDGLAAVDVDLMEVLYPPSPVETYLGNVIFNSNLIDAGPYSITYDSISKEIQREVSFEF